jgi:Rrf2 family transcriptional regulator, iron-sulfur cluster assembly transcription factor
LLSVGKDTDYAARVVLHLACLDADARVTAREIAANRLIPTAFIRRIVSRLAAAGILKTARGSGGGISLAREPSKISLREVVEAFEDTLSLNRCVGSPDSCPHADGCPVQGAWVDATRRLSRFLAKVNFEDLAARGSCARGYSAH